MERVTQKAHLFGDFGHNEFTQERKDYVLAYLAQNPFSIRAACRAVGIDPATFYRHAESDGVFRQRLQHLKAERVEQAESYLAKNAVEHDNPTWNIFFLKSHKPEVYNPVQKSEQTITLSVDTERISKALDYQHAVDATLLPSSPPLDSRELSVERKLSG